MIFQTEKQLKDLGDKIPADKKSQIEAAIAKLKDAKQKQDIAGIDAAMAEVNSIFQAVSQNLYNQGNSQQAGPQQGQNFGGQQQQQQPGGNAGNAGNNGKDNVTDVDFEEVK